MKKNIFWIFVGGIISSIFAGPASYIYHLHSGEYSEILDGIIRNNGLYEGLMISGHLTLLFTVVSFITSAIFLFIYLCLRYWFHSDSQHSYLLGWFSGFYLILFIFFIEGMTTLKYQLGDSSQISIVGWIIILMIGVALNYLAANKKRNRDSHYLNQDAHSSH